MARWDAAWFGRLAAEIARLPGLDVVDRQATRRALAADPVAFAMTYLPHHLRGPVDEDGNPGPISFSEIHFEWARIGLSWRTPPTRPQENRHAFLAPRETGKSTWWFLILPLWAAALGHVRFAVAFAHNGGMAEKHLQTFKHELDTNPLLRADFPDLVAPMRRQTSGTTVADRQGMMQQRSGFVFAAKGIDSQSLGMKVGAVRPDLIILDDVEPDEASYSPDQAEKRLGTITDAILPLNIRARVVWSGTVTMPGSLTHQLVKAANGVELADWIKDEKFAAHHHLPIMVNDDGTERSAWPSKWSLEWLAENRHTRSYAKNYANDPMARDGMYWNREDFTYGDLAGVTKVGLFIDPATTAKKTSDFTGLAVVGWAPPPAGNPKDPGRCIVLHAEGVRLIGQPLRHHVLRLLARFERIRRVFVEVNQGGDVMEEHWRTALHDLPGVRVIPHTATQSKETRFAAALDYYQRGRVLHHDKIAILEEQAVAFPRAPFDDVIDAAAAGVLRFLSPDKRVRAGVVASSSYV